MDREGPIVIREAKKILKTAGKDVPSAAITQRKSRIRQDHSCAYRSCFCGSSDKRIIWRSTGDFGDTGIVAFPADIFLQE